MNPFPIIERELRVAARAKSGHLWRVLIGVAGLIAAGLGFEEVRHQTVGGGDEILAFITTAALIFCGFSGAFLTADSISSEKRDGTLGLLFLSNLTAGDIVIGKLAAGALRFLACLLVLMPFMMVPLLKGGATWTEVARCWLGLVVVFAYSVSLGVLVSVFITEARTSVITVIVTMLAQTFLPFIAFVICVAVLDMDQEEIGLILVPSPVIIPFFSLNDLYDQDASARMIYWGCMLFLSIGAGVFLSVAAARLAHLWRRTPAVFAEQAEGRRKEGKRRRPRVPWVVELECNPYGWMIWRGFRKMKIMTWTRTLLFMLFLFFLCCVATSKSYDRSMFFLFAIGCVAILHFLSKLDLELESVRQIHDDAHKGGMELILTTPLDVQEMLDGMESGLRLRAKELGRMVVFTGIVLFLLMCIFPSELDFGNGDSIPMAILFAGATVLAIQDFKTIPWIAALQAVKRRSLAVASVVTALLIHLVPMLGFVVVTVILEGIGNVTWVEVSVLFFIWLVCTFFWTEILWRWSRNKLQHNLRQLASRS